MTKLQKAAREALAAEAGVDAAAQVTRRRIGAAPPRPLPFGQNHGQMLWDAARSIRGEKDAAKFKDYPLLQKINKSKGGFMLSRVFFLPQVSGFISTVNDR